MRSSIARRLGLDAGGTEPADRDVEGVVEKMLDATQNFAAPLTDTVGKELRGAGGGAVAGRDGALSGLGE